jgi:ABC-type multidrug transport system fused ATPase/permease subunit
MLACGLYLLRGALLLWSQCWTASIAQTLRRNMKATLFQRFLGARYEDISRQARGRIVHHLGNPPDVLYSSMINIGHVVAGMFDCVLMVGLMFYLSSWVTLITGVVAIAAIQGWRRLADPRSVMYGRTLYDLRAEQSKIEVEAVDGLKLVKAQVLEDRLTKQQTDLLEAEVRPNLRVTFLKNAPALVNEGIACLIILGLGTVTFLWPSAGIRFSMLAAFLLAVRKLAPAMARINGALVELGRSRKSLEVIEEVVRHLPQERQGGELLDSVKQVEFTDVAFAYASRPDHPVLKGVTLILRRGAVTAIVGPTGSGKSTIANVLIGLYEPQTGMIRINGIELAKLDLACWRHMVGYVSQDVFIFNASVRDNITLWNEVPESDIIWAARVVQLHEFIQTLPQGYDTLVGDRGLRLSGGQCQRVAIARAILRRPQVLIFDEATSALDNVTERALYEEISAAHRDVVVLVIAHRLSTVKDADQIMVLNAGRIVEVGTHESLIRQRSLYATLYEEGDRGERASAAGAEPTTTVATVRANGE